MPRSLRQQLADAYQEIRTLKNQAVEHTMDREAWAAPLRAQIAHLETQVVDIDRMVDDYAHLTTVASKRMSDAELYALAATVHANAAHAPETDASKRLTAELELRGIMPAKSYWERKR